MRILLIAAALLFTGCSGNKNLKTAILYPGSYRVYETDKQKDSSITFFDGENQKKAKIHSHMIFTSENIAKYELENCTVQKYEPIECNADGMYIVGKDIKSGNYDILLNENQDVGEINIYNDSYFHCYKDACFSETVTGSHEKSINLENGQSVQIYGVTLIEKNY